MTSRHGTWPTRAAVLAAAACLLAACSGGDDESAGAATTAGPVPSAGTSTAPVVTSGNGSSPATEPPAGTPSPSEPVPATISAEPPAAGLEPVGEFDAPVDLAVRPGDAALFVVEQSGRVVRADAGGDDATVVLDVSDRVSDGPEQGLLGLAFDPRSGRAFVNYTESAGDTIVTSFAIAGDGTFDVGSEQVIITIDQPHANHNGGGLAFGPDGYLYIGMGDGGSADDPDRRALDPFDLLGKLLRIDPLPGTGEPYAIPADNPFADGADGAPEVWSIGLRNPWRFTFTPAGDLWIADVGQNQVEEVNLVAPGEHPAGYAANFGWSAFEGNDRFNEDQAELPEMVAPVVTYTHDDGCSVSGGATAGGWYVYGDYCSGTLCAFDPTSGRNEVLATSVGRITTVRSGPDGAVYVLLHDGPILRL